mgnify:CR=1 FL=1
MSKPENHHSQFSSLKYKWDIQNSLDTYHKEGIEIGKERKQRQMILNMKEEGIGVDLIAKISKLPLEQVHKIIQENMYGTV